MLWHVKDHALPVQDRALVMAIINVTPDSFSDGSKHTSADAAIAYALHLAEEGADILDIGGESSRPGAEPIPVEEEIRRVLPVVKGLAGVTDLPISIDTTKAALADACLAAGAHIINDITALQGDPDMARVVADHGAGVVLMHMQGTPQTMQLAPSYKDVVTEIRQFLEARLHAATAAGIEAGRLAIDPGIGFGKTLEHNLTLLARLEKFQDLGRPVCLGVSRKGFIGKVLDRPLDERMAGSVAALCHAVTRGAAQIVRAHDVSATRDAVTLLAAIRGREARGNVSEQGGRL